MAHLIRTLQPNIDCVMPNRLVHTPECMRDQAWIGFLQVHNGLSAFNGGLRIFGTVSDSLPALEEWNSSVGWRVAYNELDEGLCFFAEDILGNQFGFDRQGMVWRFLAETGDREPCGKDFEEWLDIVLADPAEELSLWLLEDWLRENSKPRLSEHLCPKMPFVAQGATEISNLYTCGRLESMSFKGSFAHQIRNIVSGEQIQIRTK